MGMAQRGVGMEALGNFLGVGQVVINLGMTIGLAPITGIPLPLLSYGRSAMVTDFLAIGLVESVANHRQRFKF